MTRTRILIVLGIAAILLVTGGIFTLVHALRASGDHHPSTPSSSSSATSTASAAASARTQAFRAADAFCQPDETKDLWQRMLSPYLTVDAWRLFQATVPGNVPCADVTDDPQPIGDTQTATDQAYQLTAATGGPVTVTLHRAGPTAPWLVSYITPGGQP